MSVTRNGIYYNLKKSTYIVTKNNIKFYFSSMKHLEKFNKQLEENRDTISYSLYKRFKLWVKIDELCDLSLYSKIESRGFFVVIEGVEHVCLKNLILDGAKTIVKK